MHRPIYHVNSAIKAGIGREPVLSVVEACWAVETAVREALEEAAIIAEDRAPVVQCMSVEPIVAACFDIADRIRRLADSPASGGANDG